MLNWIIISDYYVPTMYIFMIYALIFIAGVLLQYSSLKTLRKDLLYFELPAMASTFTWTSAIFISLLRYGDGCWKNSWAGWGSLALRGEEMMNQGFGDHIIQLLMVRTLGVSVPLLGSWEVRVGWNLPLLHLPFCWFYWLWQVVRLWSMLWLEAGQL